MADTKMTNENSEAESQEVNVTEATEVEKTEIEKTEAEVTKSKKNDTKIVGHKKKWYKSRVFVTTVKTFIMVMIFCSTLIVSYYGLNYLLVPLPQDKDCLRYQAMLNNPDELDAFVLGTSLSERGINTKLISENTDYNWYNLSTSNQTAVERYFFVKEIIRVHNPKYIFLEFGNDTVVRKNNLRYSSYIDTIPLNKDKIDLAFGINNNNNPYVDLFFPFVKYFDQIGNIGKNVSQKNQGGYPGINETVLNHGHYPTTESIDPGDWGSQVYTSGAFSTDEVFNESRIDSVQYNAMKDAITYAKSRGIEVILYYPPMSYAEIARNPERYQAISDYAQKFAKAMGVKFYNFNFIKNSKFERYERPIDTALQNEKYYDLVHMNDFGSTPFAEVFSDFFKQVINGDTPASDFLLEDIYEIFDDAPYIYKVQTEYNHTAKHFEAEASAGNAIEVLYKYFYRYSGDSWHEIRTYSSNAVLTEEELLEKIFDISGEVKDGNIAIKVEARQNDASVSEQYYTLAMTIKNGKVIDRV